MIGDSEEARQKSGSPKALFILEMFCFAVFVSISSYVLSEILTGKADDVSTLEDLESLFNIGFVLVGLFYIACERICTWLDQRHSQSQLAIRRPSSCGPKLIDVSRGLVTPREFGELSVSLDQFRLPTPVGAAHVGRAGLDDTLRGVGDDRNDHRRFSSM